MTPLLVIGGLRSRWASDRRFLDLNLARCGVGHGLVPAQRVRDAQPALHLVLLGIFKYLDFLVSSANQLAHLLGFSAEVEAKKMDAASNSGPPVDDPGVAADGWRSGNIRLPLPKASKKQTEAEAA